MRVGHFSRHVAGFSLRGAASGVLLLVALATLCLIVGGDLAHAAGSSPFGLAPGAGATGAAPPAHATGPLSALWNWVLTQQALFTRELTAGIKRFKTENVVTASALLASASFAYGVLHAAGPGHGKAVISSYVLANERTVRRGIQLSFLAALFQALSAIIIVGVCALLLHATSVKMRAAETVIETMSWGFVMLAGAWLLYRQLAPMMKPGLARLGAGAELHGHGTRRGHAHATGGHDHHDQAHDHDHAHHAAPGDDHGATHVHDANCGHSHIIDPGQLEGAWSWRRAVLLALSVGIRPCSGAIIVLVFALSQGLVWAGILATFAMALGTAITVSVLAAMAVGSRELATRLAGASAGWIGGVERGVALAGAALVFLMGAAFFIASLQGTLAVSPL